MKEYQIRFILGILKLTCIIWLAMAVLVIVPVVLYKLLVWMFS